MTAPLRAVHMPRSTPRSFAPSSIRAIRPAAPAWLNGMKVCHTDQLPPVTISPHFGSVSTCTIATLFQSASSSSATMRASAVPTCWPISARMMLTVIRPSRPIEYQMVGSNRSPAVGLRPASNGNSAAASAERAYPSTMPASIVAIRKLRRESASPSGPHVHGVREKLSTRSSSYARCGKLDGAADADVGHTPTQVACHHRIDVLVSWIWIILEQGSRLHDLAGLAVTALRNLQIDPCGLQRMAPIGIESFDGRDFGAGDCAHRGDARPGRATFDMDGAGAAHPDATTKLGPCEAELVADYP